MQKDRSGATRIGSRRSGASMYMLWNQQIVKERDDRQHRAHQY